MVPFDSSPPVRPHLIQLCLMRNSPIASTLYFLPSLSNRVVKYPVSLALRCPRYGELQFSASTVLTWAMAGASRAR
jgi:hypothetical protein